MSGDKTTWRVAFTRRAEEDSLGIFSFIAERDGPDIAETMLGAFIEARDSLRERPDRGNIPPELKRVNVLSYREIQVSRYRVVYQVNKTTHEVYVSCRGRWTAQLHRAVEGEAAHRFAQRKQLVVTAFPRRNLATASKGFARPIYRFNRTGPAHRYNGAASSENSKNVLFHHTRDHLPDGGS